MKPIKALKALIGSAALALAPAAALAQQPAPWEMGLQAPATPVADDLHFLHNVVLNGTITVITLFVLALLIIVMVKFNRKANPNPSKTTHNTMLEIVWTAVPVLILVVIAIPSLRVLYFLDRVEDADMTVKVVGHQWYWSYEYPDHDDLTFESYMVDEEDLEPGQPRLLTVDNALVLPAGKNIRLLLTSEDVIHSWAVPSLGVKLDTVPGRLNETWVRINEPGTYYGQCSELCGVNHGFMPITVKAVTEAEFATWLVEAKEEFAEADESETDDEVKLAQSATQTGEASYE